MKDSSQVHRMHTARGEAIGEFLRQLGASDIVELFGDNDALLDVIGEEVALTHFGAYEKHND